MQIETSHVNTTHLDDNVHSANFPYDPLFKGNVAGVCAEQDAVPNGKRPVPRPQSHILLRL